MSTKRSDAKSVKRPVGRPRKTPATDLAVSEAVKDASRVDEATDAYLRAEAIVQAINANLPPGRQLQPISKDYVFRKRDRETVAIAFHAAFENMGGTAALLEWAKQNPGKFFALFAKLGEHDVPINGGNTQINILSSLPATPHDDVWIDLTGKVHKGEVEELDEGLPE